MSKRLKRELHGLQVYVILSLLLAIGGMYMGREGENEKLFDYGVVVFVYSVILVTYMFRFQHALSREWKREPES